MTSSLLPGATAALRNQHRLWKARVGACISKPEQVRTLQVNLVRSHCCGVGESLGEAETRAMMLLRANALAKGFSGVRPLVVETLCAMLNAKVHPVIPSQGSVGASGDLAPLAHLAAVVIGEGRAVYKGEILDGGAAMIQRAGIKPVALEERRKGLLASKMAHRECSPC